MMSEENGPDFLLRRAREVGCDVRVGSAPTAVPEQICGSPLDPELRDLLQRHDGVTISGDLFALSVFGVGGSHPIDRATERLRSMEEDFEYDFGGLVPFAQYGLQAANLCCVPTLADGDGRQPVIYVDNHEQPWAMPIASSVDQAFRCIAGYLTLLEHGVNRVFPHEVPELVRDDARLIELARARSFGRWLGDPLAHTWIRSITQTRDSG